MIKHQNLKDRTKKFTLSVIEFVEALPKIRTGDIIGKQLLRSGTSVGANYRAACRARSRADFVAKMGVVEEEIDECMYWLELLDETGLIPPDKFISLIKEANEITSIVVSSIKTTRENNK